MPVRRSSHCHSHRHECMGDHHCQHHHHRRHPHYRPVVFAPTYHPHAHRTYAIATPASTIGAIVTLAALGFTFVALAIALLSPALVALGGLLLALSLCCLPAWRK